MFTGLPDWIVYIILLVVATVVAGRIWALCVATWEFAKDFVIPIAKVLLIVVLWIVLILLVNKLELVFADFNKLSSDMSTDIHRLVQDITAPLFASLF